MSEVISITTGEPWQHVPRANADVQARTKGIVGRIIDSIAASKNDRLRRMTPLAKIEASIAVKEVMCSDDGTALRNLYRQFQTSEYDEIDFGTLSNDMISAEMKRLSGQLHSAGVIHPSDDPNMSVVWQIDQNMRKISFWLATEFFQKPPA